MFLAFDQGAHKSGWCVYDEYKNVIVAVSTIKVSTEIDWNIRIKMMEDAYCDIIETYNPKCIFAENISFRQPNQWANLYACSLEYTLNCISDKYGIPVVFVGNTQWKKYIGLSGSATSEKYKPYINKMLKRTENNQLNEDECASIGIMMRGYAIYRKKHSEIKSKKKKFKDSKSIIITEKLPMPLLNWD